MAKKLELRTVKAAHLMRFHCNFMFEDPKIGDNLFLNNL